MLKFIGYKSFLKTTRSILMFTGFLLTLSLTGCQTYKEDSDKYAIRDNEEINIEKVDALASDLGFITNLDTERDTEEAESFIRDSMQNIQDNINEKSIQDNLDKVIEYLGTDSGLRLCDITINTSSGDYTQNDNIIASSPIKIDGVDGIIAVVGIHRGRDAAKKVSQINENGKILADLNNNDLEYCAVDFVVVLNDEVSETSSDIGLIIKGWNPRNDKITDSITADGKSYSGGGVYFNQYKEDKINIAGSGEYVFTLPIKSNSFALIFSNNATIKIQ